MSQVHNGAPNGHGLHAEPYISKRFTDIPATIDIAVAGGDDSEAVEIDLEELLDDPTEICSLLENERAARSHWMTVSLAYAKQKKVDQAIEMMTKALTATNPGPKEKLSLYSCLCWMYLWKSREASRLANEKAPASEARTKEYYLQQSTLTLNEASRIQPSFPPLFLARGVLYLLRASLQTPSKGLAPGALDPEKTEMLKMSLKSFDDAIRMSGDRNMMAVLGKARVLFSQNKYELALKHYQDVLRRMPDLIDPDPRIGIGCCLWKLNFKGDAKVAWERALEINPESKIATILLGLYYLEESNHKPVNSPEFIRLYKKAMTEYTQKAYKLDKDYPLVLATFAGFFLSRKSLPNVNTLAHKAIEYTDVNAIAGDGWYLLARSAHYAGDLDMAMDYYRRADEARGGADRGFIPAKFGAAQLSVLKNDVGEAKLRLEKILQLEKNTQKSTKNFEVLTLLGTLYAEEVFAAQYGASKEDKTEEYKKATSYLETVRRAMGDASKGLPQDPSVLLNLARLYEIDSPDQSLQCLQRVEEIELERLPESEQHKDIEDDEARKTAQRKHLPPQLLNNMGCFLYRAEKFEKARYHFETAINACLNTHEGKDMNEVDVHGLITTISFNLGRTYEASGLLDLAKDIYGVDGNGLLQRQPDYTDARTRLAYIDLKQNPTGSGAKTVTKLYEDAPHDLEVRALYGWYLNHQHKRRDEQEQKLYRHTLKYYANHDLYALVGMGNLFLTQAREMPRNTDSERQKRSQTYSKAVEFFEKTLRIDPKNAYAAQGIAIALVEDRKDYKTALNIFLQIKDTVKDFTVYLNIGHLCCEPTVKRFAQAIENYEIALSKDRGSDAVILTCLGRAWLYRGRDEKNIAHFRMALEYAQKALACSPEAVHIKFNIAYIQTQIAQQIHQLPETQRTLLEVQTVATDLDTAIASFDDMAKHPQPPYPKDALEQRANMARNTTRNQLTRALQAQREYEDRNKEKIAKAREEMERKLKAEEEKRKQKAAEEEERKQKLREERAKLQEEAKRIAERRAEEERAREEAEYTTDEEGQRVKRKKRPARGAGGGGGKRRKKQGSESGDESAGDDAGKKRRRARSKTADGEDKPKKRKLQRKGAAEKKEKSGGGSGNYKSREYISEDDSDGDNGVEEAERAMRAESRAESEAMQASGDAMDVDSPKADAADDDDDEEEEVRAKAPNKRQRSSRIVESDDEDEEGESGAANGDTSMADAPPTSAPAAAAVDDDEDE